MLKTFSVIRNRLNPQLVNIKLIKSFSRKEVYDFRKPVSP